MSTLTRTRAQRMTRLAQGAGLLVAACAALAVVALDSRPPDALRELPDPPAPAAPSGPAPSSGDEPRRSGDLVAVARQLAVAWTPPEKPSVPKPDRPSNPGVANSSAWRYLGSIIEPTRRLALISDGRQRIAAEGQEIADGVRLREVGEAHVILEINGRPERIAKADRFGSLLSSSASPIAGAPAVGNVLFNQMNGGESREDIQALIREREARAARARLVQTQIGANGVTSTATPVPDDAAAMQAEEESGGGAAAEDN